MYVYVSLEKLEENIAFKKTNITLYESAWAKWVECDSVLNKESYFGNCL